MKITVGTVFADSMEYAPFLAWAQTQSFSQGLLYGNECVTVRLSKGGRELEIIAVKCGIGKVNAAAATAYLISDKKADIILNAGLSGAVANLKREDMVAGESYVECDYDLTAIGKALGEKCDGQPHILYADKKLLSYALESKGIKSAKLGTGDIFLTDGVKKKLFYDTFGVEAFDMETGAIASVCQKAEIPMLSLRKISDDADDDALENYREMNDRQESCLTELLVNIFDRIISG